MRNCGNLNKTALLATLSVCLLSAACSGEPAQLEKQAAAQTQVDTIETAAPTQTRTLAPSQTPTPTTVPTSTITPTPFGGGGEIAFSSDRDGNYEIYVMQPDGSEQTRVTYQDADDLNPEWSPSANYLAYWSLNLSVDPPISDIQYIRPDGSDQGSIGFGVETVCWHPTQENRVMLVRFNGEGMEIIQSRFGETVELVTNHPADDHMQDWSPDGRQVAFVSNRAGQNYIYIMTIGNDDAQRLTDGEEGELEPAWSPDGDMIAFAAGDNETQQIYIVNTDGSGLTQLTGSRGINEHPTWSPDGKWIAFWSDRTGDREIYVTNLDGSELFQLTDNNYADENPRWSR